MNIKQQMVDKTRRDLKRLAKQLWVAENLPDNLPHVYNGYIVKQEVCLKMPANLQMLREFRRALGKDWHQVSVRVSDDGYVAREYRNTVVNGKLLLWQKPNIDGSTCTRTQTGERTIPIYNIICS